MVFAVAFRGLKKTQPHKHKECTPIQESKWKSICAVVSVLFNFLGFFKEYNTKTEKTKLTEYFCRHLPLAKK